MGSAFLHLVDVDQNSLLAFFYFLSNLSSFQFVMWLSLVSPLYRILKIRSSVFWEVKRRVIRQDELSDIIRIEKAVYVVQELYCK